MRMSGLFTLAATLFVTLAGNAMAEFWGEDAPPAPPPVRTAVPQAAPPVKPLAPRPAADDPRRLLFAQIVEDDRPDVFQESAVIEGAAFKYFLRESARLDHDQMRKLTNEQITFENLMAAPGLFRGQVVTLARGVMVEISRAELPPEYGLPGYTVLPGVFVDAAFDVYAVRILCPPKSKLFEKLKKGIDDDLLPVLRMSGFFMKLYARTTSDPREPPWRRPLLVCPEPGFSIADPRSVQEDMRVNKTDKLLPSRRIEAPGVEERLVVELLAPQAGSAQPRVRIGGKLSDGELNAWMAGAVREFEARLPADQRDAPAAVVLVSSGVLKAPVNDVLSALRAAGVKRLAIKREP
jgi:hypothetical protein